MRPVLLLLLAFLLSAGAAAQDLPDRPIRLIVPFPPGGGSDAVARIVAESMGPILPRGMVVENRSGANGMVGMAEVARAPADGTVLAFCFMGPCALNHSFYPNQPYDLLRDFAPVGMIGASMNVLTVPAAMPVRDVAEFVAYARAQPQPLTYASSGVGSTTHLAPELLRGRTEIALLHVPYRGGGSVMADHLAGRVDIFVNTTIVMVPYIRAGTLRPLAVTGAVRAAELPDVPTFAEAGVEGVVMAPWFGIVAPAATPSPAVTRLNAALNAAMTSPATLAKLREGGLTPEPGTPDAFGAYIRAEIARWAEVIRANDIRAE